MLSTPPSRFLRYLRTQPRKLRPATMRHSQVTAPLPVDLGHPQPWTVARHMGLKAFSLMPLLLATLFLGMALYHWIEGLAWADSFLNASMLLGGMGPVDRVATTTG